MSSESQGPFHGREQTFSRSEPTKITNSSLTSKPRKIDFTGMMGKLFASVGVILVVNGLILERGTSGEFSFFWETGLLFVLLGLALPLFFRHVRSANIVDHYFMALVNQDYTTAFQYLDPGIKTSQDKPNTQTWFIQRAQAADAQGKITDYALKRASLSLKSARYAVKIKRGERSYSIRLFLSKR